MLGLQPVVEHDDEQQQPVDERVAARTTVSDVHPFLAYAVASVLSSLVLPVVELPVLLEASDDLGTVLERMHSYVDSQGGQGVEEASFHVVDSNDSWDPYPDDQGIGVVLLVVLLVLRYLQKSESFIENRCYNIFFF